MNRRSLFTWLAAASGYTGIGMLLGYSFGDKANNTPLWLGALLVLLGALLLGMYVSSREGSPSDKARPKQAGDPNKETIVEP
jgi:drug/metabolite transporter (DMT)-like permease